VGARVLTLDGERPRAEGLLVEAGTVTAVGSTDEVLRHAGDCAVLDLAGRAVLPGFVDGHCHFELTCVTTDHWIGVHTPPHESLASVAERIRAELPRRPDGDWALCRSSFAMQDKVVEGRLFDRHELDAITTSRPLAVFASLHVASLNTLALQRLGLWEPDSPHPFHGVVHRDGAGRPTGVVTEVFMMVPAAASSTEFARTVTDHAADLFNAAGTTSVHTMPESLGQIEIERTLHERGELSVRQIYYLISPGVATLEQAEVLARRDGRPGRFQFGGIKVFVNGCAHDGLGVAQEDPKWTQASLDDFVRYADSRGMQVWLHALSAAGVRMAAAAIRAAAPSGDNPRRHRIEHGGDFIDLADLEVVRASGALLVTTPQFLHSMTTDPTGPRAPLRSLLAAGVRLVGGTDSTGTVPSSVSIVGNVQTAVARRRSDGTQFHPDESIPVEAALALFTTGSSFGAFAETRTGRLAPGMLADFVVLSDLPGAVGSPPPGEIEVLATYVGGERVWSR
jgi:predicted amidohydrolase YtcJ